MFVYGFCNRAWYVDPMTMFDLLPYFGFADVMYLDIICVHTYLLCFLNGRINLYISWEHVYKNMIKWFCRICLIYLMMTICFPCFHQNCLERNHILSWIFDILCIPRLYLTLTINSSIAVLREYCQLLLHPLF